MIVSILISISRSVEAPVHQESHEATVGEEEQNKRMMVWVAVGGLIEARLLVVLDWQLTTIDGMSGMMSCRV